MSKRRRKLTQERIDRINRSRDLREGDRSFERDALRLVLIDGRVHEICDDGPGRRTVRGRE